MRPNVVLVVFDTARADVLSPYGAASEATPALSDLARMGWAADHCYSTSNWTVPSHLSLFTGALPRHAGIDGKVPPATVVRANADRSLARVLSSQGYATAAASANPWIASTHGFGEGFDRFVDIRPPLRPAPRRDARGFLRWARAATTAHIDAGLNEIDDTVEGWLRDAKGSEPFFWFVNLMECHSPYLPPKPYNDLSVLSRLVASREAARYQSHDRQIGATLGAVDVPNGAIARMNHLYRRGIRSMDDWLARFLERLEQRGALEDTIVAVVSDHGENLGDGGLFGHMLSLDDRLIHVPFVCGGGVVPDAPAGVTSLADVPRILADTIGLSAHPWNEPACPDGVAFSMYDGFATFSPEYAEGIADRIGISQEKRRRLYGSGDSATEGRFKLVRIDGSDVLYDLRQDPLETRDATADHPDVAVRLRAALNTSLGRARQTFTIEPEAPEPDDELADLEERMRVLGYL